MLASLDGRLVMDGTKSWWRGKNGQIDITGQRFLVGI